MPRQMPQYWAEVRSRWDAALESVNVSKEAVTTIRKPRLPFLLPTNVQVAITGERGAGKTALYSMLVGDSKYRNHKKSVAPEMQRTALYTKIGRRRSTFVVVPGQDSPTHTDVLDRLFAPKSVPMGIIHVVSAGYDWVWETNNRELIADRFESEAKGRAIAVAEFASRVEKASPPASEDVRLLAKLQELQGQSPTWHLRTEFQKSEFERFRTLCQDHLQSTWGEANGGKQIWLIIAVSKSDLWYDDRETLKSYYIPSATGEGDSPFSAELRELVSVVGASRLSRIAVLPVASYPRHYRFSRYFGEQRPVLDAQQTESLLNNFRNMVGEFCGNRRI